ncbi:MAG: hypothetical protein ACRDQH_16355, partial [Pseudonocardiaceae bacterium]
GGDTDIALSELARRRAARPAGPSNAERAAAAAAESAAAYQKYVAGPAAEGESDTPAGWSPAV